MKRLQAENCIYGEINSFAEVVSHPQTAARHMFTEITTPAGTCMTAPANPLVLDGCKSCGTTVYGTKLCHECGKKL